MKPFVLAVLLLLGACSDASTAKRALAAELEYAKKLPVVQK